MNECPKLGVGEGQLNVHLWVKWRTKNQLKDDVYCCPTARERRAIDAMVTCSRFEVADKSAFVSTRILGVAVYGSGRFQPAKCAIPAY